MFGLRWITAVSVRWHSRPDCPALRAQRTRDLRRGLRPWIAYLITAGYGRDFYLPCRRCAV